MSELDKLIVAAATSMIVIYLVGPLPFGGSPRQCVSGSLLSLYSSGWCKDRHHAAQDIKRAAKPALGISSMKGGLRMNGSGRDPGAGIGLILLVVLLYIIFNPIPGPIDDLAVAGIGGYQALKRL